MDLNKKCLRPLGINVIVNLNINIAIKDNQDTGQTGQKSQRWETGQTDLTFKLDFPGNLFRAAFAILAMFLGWSQISKSNRVSLNWATDIGTYIEISPLKRKILLKPLDFEHSVTVKVLKASLCPAAFLYQIFSTDLQFKASEPLDLANVI